MKRHSTLLLLLVVVISAACAEILGIRPPGHTPFEHRSHVLKGITCARCHAGVSNAGEEGPLHIPGSAECKGCHERPHDDHECANCHGLPSTRAGAARARDILRFQHSTHVPRAKGNCVRCHLDIASGADVLRPRMPTCAGCHNQHVAQLSDNCDACHVNIKDEGIKPDDHLIHGGNFLREHGLRAAADRQACAACHQERFCISCHGVTVPALPEKLNFDDPMRAGVHRAGFKARHPEEAKGDPGLCTTCHSPKVCSDCHAKEKIAFGSTKVSPHPSGWLGVRGTRNDHGRAALREPELCASCHSGAGEAMCVSCHKVGGSGGNPHGPSFNSRKRPRTDRPCLLCHGGGP